MTISVKNFIRNFSIILVGTLILSACDPSVYGPGTKNSKRPKVSAADYARRGNHAAAARAYKKLADQASGIQRDKYLLETAHQWFALQRYAAAQDELAAIRTLLDSESQIRKILLQTRVLLELEQAEQALISINTLNPQDSIDIARPYHLLKGQALFELGQIIDGTKEFLARERFTRNLQELQDNRTALWYTLKDKVFLGERNDYSEEDELLIGWISLAEQFGSSAIPRTQKTLLEQWREVYPTHPAYNYALESLYTNMETGSLGELDPLEPIESIGVLLPFSGRLARAGEIIKQGIQSANRRRTTPLSLFFYDTELGAGLAYQSAVNSQVDAIIGPLSKSNIDLISTRISTVPTLALNRIDNVFGLPGLLQFGLAPEDEAVLAAQFALSQGYTQAVTLTSQNNWGERLLTAFSEAFINGGGTIVEEARYSTRDNDHSLAITSLLNLDESKQRYRQVSNLLGADIEYEARRRLDIDFIFVAAQANQARLIRPQLKFHYASRIPVYASSHAFAADPIRNKDINDVQFAASEWLIDPLQRDALLADELNISEESVPNSQQIQLFSLGFDAINYLDHLTVDPKLNFQGLSGELSIDEYGVIHRNMPLAIVRNGRIVKEQEKLEEFILTPLVPFSLDQLFEEPSEVIEDEPAEMIENTEN